MYNIIPEDLVIDWWITHCVDHVLYGQQAIITKAKESNQQGCFTSLLYFVWCKSNRFFPLPLLLPYTL